MAPAAIGLFSMTLKPVSLSNRLWAALLKPLACHQVFPRGWRSLSTRSASQKSSPAAGWAAESGEELFQFRGFPDVVLVRQEHDIAGAKPHGLFEVPDESEVLGIADQAHLERGPLHEVADDPDRVVDGVVVANDHLVGKPGLTGKALQLLQDMGCTVVGAHGDRDAMAIGRSQPACQGFPSLAPHFQFALRQQMVRVCRRHGRRRRSGYSFSVSPASGCHFIRRRSTRPTACRAPARTRSARGCRQHGVDVERALGLQDEVAHALRRAEVLADHRADERHAHRGVQAREHPAGRARQIDVAQQLPAALAPSMRALSSTTGLTSFTPW